MSLGAEEAARIAAEALARFRPDATFNLLALKSPLKRHPEWVFRARMKGGRESVICKLSGPDAASRAKIRGQRDRLAAMQAAFPRRRLAVPAVLAHYDDLGALVLEDCKGRALKDILPEASADAIVPLLARSGRWVAQFQAPTTRRAGFNPKPHVNWLSRKVEAHRRGESPIADFDAFAAPFAALKAGAAAVSGAPSRLCVTHRDFHAGNIVFTGSGRACGLDFENDSEDVALRDVMSFLFDVVIRWDRNHGQGWADLDAAIAGFHAGYGDDETAGAVFDWFQAFFALNTWTELGEKSAFSANRAHRLDCLKLLADQPLRAAG